MSTSAGHIDVAPARHSSAPWIALVLAIVSLPGSLLPWDWFTAGGLVIGLPLAIAAIALGVVARRAAAPRTTALRVATAAVVLGILVVLIPVAWVIAAAF
jgi:hypothetical protein